MTKGWKILPFEECIEKVTYPEKVQRKNFLESGDYPVISQEKEFINGYWDDPDALFKITRPVVIFGDHTRVLKYVDFNFVLGADGVKILQPISVINPKYFYYFLSSIEIKSLGYARHYRLLTEINVSFPSPPDQQRIVSVLDEAFASIAQAKSNAERNLANARELFEIFAQSIFENKGEGWQENKLNEVCELKSGTTVPASLERNKGDVLYTKIADMNLPENLVEIHTSSRFVNRDEINQNQIIPEGAIIFPKRGGAIATNKKRKIIKPTIVDLNTMAIIPSKKIDKDFLFYWFQLFDLKDISNGANIPQINHYSFDEIYIPYPKSLAEQRAIVGRLGALSAETGRLEEIYQSKLEALEELKKSVLAKAFNGEL